jgi:hypothetical protein
VQTQSKSFTKDDFRKRAFEDHEYFCRELFPVRFFLPFSDAHKEIIQLMYSNHQFVCIVAPKKFGKSPLICESDPMKRILYNLEAYIIIVSETMDESKRYVQRITAEFETNEKLQYYYGNMVDRRNRETQKESVQFANGIWLRAKSYLSQIRGTTGDKTPPSLIIVDDPQSNKDVRTSGAIKNAVDWFEDEVLYGKAYKWMHTHYGTIGTGRVRLVGTSLHHLCLVEQYVKDPRFVSKRYAALMKDGTPDLNGESVWPAMWTTEELRKEYKAAQDAGRGHNWLQEKMNMPYSFGERVFDPDDSRYWDMGSNRFDIINGEPVFIMDEDLNFEFASIN